jgi:hypothetical protein
VRDWLTTSFFPFMLHEVNNMLQSMQNLLLCIFFSPTLVFRAALHTPNKREGVSSPLLCESTLVGPIHRSRVKELKARV